MTNGQLLLSVRRVVRSYAMGGLFGRNARAVDDVSFDVGAEGPEILAIIGESGSGKTTLARMILGTVRPSAGSICFKGVDLAEMADRPVYPEALNNRGGIRCESRRHENAASCPSRPLHPRNFGCPCECPARR